MHDLVQMLVTTMTQNPVLLLRNMAWHALEALMDALQVLPHAAPRSQQELRV